MKKNILKIAVVSLFIGALALNFGIARYNSNGTINLKNIMGLSLVSAESSDCTHGCVEGSGGCYCKESYPQYKEAN
jgi:hypothetical protein